MPAMLLSGGVAIATALAQPMLAQDGTVTYTTQQGTQNIQYTKGQMVRLELNQGQQTGMSPGAVIVDGSTGNMTILMTAQKMYMQANLSAAGGAAGAGSGSQAPATQFTVTPGGTETIAGETCQDYTISGVNPRTGKSGSGIVCATTGLGVINPFKQGGGNPFARMLQNNPQMAALTNALNQVNGKAILRASGMSGNPNAVDVLVTKVDPTSPPDSLFKVPAGYTQFQAPGGMGAGGIPGMGATPKSH